MLRKSLVSAVAVTALALPGVAHAGLISSASATPTAGNGSAVDVAGVVQLGSSHADATGSRWDIATVGGTSLLGVSNDGSGSTWTGSLAPLGPVLDNYYENSCQTVLNIYACVILLHGQADGSSASGSLAKVIYHDNDAGSTAVYDVGPSDASYAACLTRGDSDVLVYYAPDGSVGGTDPSHAVSSC